MPSLSANLMGWAPQKNKIKCSHKIKYWGLTPFFSDLLVCCFFFKGLLPPHSLQGHHRRIPNTNVCRDACNHHKALHNSMHARQNAKATSIKHQQYALRLDCRLVAGTQGSVWSTRRSSDLTFLSAYAICRSTSCQCKNQADKASD